MSKISPRKRRQQRIKGDLKSTDARDWKFLLQSLTIDLESLSRLVIDEMQNSLVVLGITSAKAQIQPEGSAEDVEAAGDALIPGRKDFASNFEKGIHKFNGRRQKMRASCAALATTTSEQERQERNSHANTEDLFVLLFMEHLLSTLFQATAELVEFADSKIADKTMEHSRLIFP